MYVGFQAAGRVTAALCIAVGSVTPTGVLTTPDPVGTVEPTTTRTAPAPTTTAVDASSATIQETTTTPPGTPTTTPSVAAATSAGTGTGTGITTTTPATTTPATATPHTTAPVTTTPVTTPVTTTSADPVAPPVADPPGGTASADYQAGYDAGYSAGFAAGRAAAGGTGGTSTGGTSTGSTSTSSTGPAPVAPAGPGTSAATRFGWGTPTRVDDFTGGLGQWGVYNGAGHGGNGRRSPSAVTTQNGVLTIAGDANGTTGGMSWGPGAKYGRWEARVQAPASDPSYHAVALLWPDEENWPVGGEVDFMEMMDASRQVTNMFLHYGASNSQVSGSVRIDATQWHNWAVEWTPDHIAAFVDGQEWWRTTNTAILPPGPMHLTLQLDWFPQGGSVRPSAMHVDQVAYYPL